MTARLVDRARAFQMIADHLPEARRTEVATALADELSPQPRSKSLAERVDAAVIAGHPYGVDEVTAFLVGEGFEGPGLVRASMTLRTLLATGARSGIREAYEDISDALEVHRA